MNYMLVNLKLGFRDIWKHKFFFVVCVAFLVLFNNVQLLLPATIYYMNRAEDQPGDALKSFNLIYTQYEYVYDRDDLVDIAGIYANNAVSVNLSRSLSEALERSVYLVFGDCSIINPGMVNQDGIFVYAYDNEDLKDIEILGVSYPIRQINQTDTVSEYSYHGMSTIFVVYQGNAMVEIIDYIAQGRPDIFWELIAETHILGSDKNRIESFTDFVTGRMEGLAFKGNFMWGTTLYHDFLYFYMVPLLVVLSLTGVISFLLIFRGIVQKMKRDLTIHLQSGARVRDLLLRFYVFYFSIIGIAFSYLYLTKAVVDLTLPYILAFYLIITVSVCFYIALVLMRSNLFENLRGDIQ